MNRFDFKWLKKEPLSGLHYTCGYCGTYSAPSTGWHTEGKGIGNDTEIGYIFICAYCNRPSFAHYSITKKQFFSITPSPKIGKEIDGLPADIATLYDDARKCSSAGAYTSAILTCRKILMHIAVEKGAPPNKGFIEYVEYLADKNYIPHDGRDWVDYIRTKSNEANHEIQVMSAEDAEDLITFTEMLLRLVYEFKNRLAKKAAASDQATE